MKKQQKLLVLAIIMDFIATALFLPGLVSAGELEPGGPPTTGTMHTLEQIYEVVLDTNSKVNGGASCEGAPVEKTGQTTSYATGDDGDLEKGVTWPSPRFTDNGDGTVTDNLTGLIWLMNANCGGQMTWNQALNDCNTLASGSCGLTDDSVAGDWRLPNVKELQSLIHYGFCAPCLPDAAGTSQWSEGDPFFAVQSDRYWSSTTYAGYTGAAWFVSMGSGYVFSVDKGSYYVWPVRSDN